MEGNQMKMREALEGLARAVRAFMATKGANFYPDVAIAIEAANAALSYPPRNCDVGTAAAQWKRFNAFCDQRVCERCELPMAGCRFAWSQMPYEAEEGESNGVQSES